ncbi:MAG: zinc-dependent alcohol dehydrogenase family protein [Alphaproteobacteria bacterium]|nr:zinc-dependent alcohol dehydrogenase family protein [Alphaproteobacteria bacterium]
MRAMVLDAPGRPLREAEIARPVPGHNQVLIKIAACAVCRTDLHVVDGDLKQAKLPLVPGHEVIGVVAQVGSAVANLEMGLRVGVPWLGGTCGDCRYCREGQENLCDRAQFTGYTLDGGFADYIAANSAYVFPIPDDYGEEEAAPLMCAGLIGFRSYRMVRDARRLGLYGFGAAAHIIAQVARHEGKEVMAFTKAGDAKGQAFARGLGAVWAGGSDELPPNELDAAIIFAPVGPLLPTALRAVRKGGTVICAGIHMTDIPSFPYAILWGERIVRSVANLTREDAVAFLEVAPRVPVRTTTHPYPLVRANQALDDLRAGRLDGAAVLMMD